MKHFFAHAQNRVSTVGPISWTTRLVFFNRSHPGTEAAVSCKSGSFAACTTCVLASWRFLVSGANQLVGGFGANHPTPCFLFGGFNPL